MIKLLALIYGVMYVLEIKVVEESDKTQVAYL